MEQNLAEELVNLIRDQLREEERRMRSERIKLGWQLRKERLAREKEAMALVKAKH